MSKITVIHTEKLTQRPELNARHSAQVWAVEIAKTAMKTGDEITPLWVIVAGRTVLYISTPWEDEHEKEAVLYSLREAMAKFGATRYCFMSETWISSQEIKEDALEKGEYVQPSQDPEARDGLIVLSADAKGHEAACYEVKYDDSGKKVVRYLEEITGYTNVGGRMAELLK